MDDGYRQLVAALQDIEQRLKTAENKLNYATDELLIDSIIYEMEALYKRHSYYLRLCRQLYSGAGEEYAV